MSRRRKAQKREKLPDPKFNSLLVSQFISSVMKAGKKHLAEMIFYDAIDIVAKKTQQDGIAIFKKAVENVKPNLEVKSRRIGGANYQVPVEVAPNRRGTLAIRWLITYSRQRSEKTMADKLANEFIQAANNEGGAVRKKVDTHKMAEANKAFAHFRW